MNLYEYAVGKPYSITRTEWPDGATDYNYREGAHELRIFWANPSPEEIGRVKKSTIEFALIDLPPSLFLLWKFRGDTEWSDKSYNWWLVPAEQRTMPNPEPTAEERALLHILLIDAATGIVRAMRAVTFSPAFSAALHAAIRIQAVSVAPDLAAYDAHCARLYEQFPRSSDMAAVAPWKCVGGE